MLDKKTDSLQTKDFITIGDISQYPLQLED